MPHALHRVVEQGIVLHGNSKWNDNVITVVEAYYASCKEKKEIPYVEEVAVELDITRDTLYTWIKDHKNLADTIKKIQNLQRIMLLKATLDRNKATGGIFQLKANHGTVEASKLDVTSNGEKIEPTIIYRPQKVTEE